MRERRIIFYEFRWLAKNTCARSGRCDPYWSPDPDMSVSRPGPSGSAFSNVFHGIPVLRLRGPRYRTMMTVAVRDGHPFRFDDTRPTAVDGYSARALETHPFLVGHRVMIYGCCWRSFGEKSISLSQRASVRAGTHPAASRQRVRLS